ncbi:MAG: 16S rRNA (guanine(527)-N(7))-methyltransferase RsmG [Nitrospinae bacterium]|nr:16S rRNA (guanine(527)-N(7))-methyltransferase RsmG [Nitrospinota bacterium]
MPLGSGVDPSRAAEQLLVYLVEWKRWNAKINLTAETDERSVIDKHIYESLQYARAISPSAAKATDPGSGGGFSTIPLKVADLGSGGGFPGIPLKVALPDLDMVLVESQRKRANFLKAVIRAMGLKNIRCVQCRVEELDASFQNAFDFVVLRHVQELDASLEMGRSLLKNPGGRLVLQKEATSSADGLSSAGGLRLHAEIPLPRLSGSPSKLMIFQNSPPFSP